MKKPKFETRDGLRQLHSITTSFETREADDGSLHICGYFAVFGPVYEMNRWQSESIAPGAFRNCLDSDVRALTNHDTTLVLGRTTARTLTLREDERGLWGDIIVNQRDLDAMNTYERVKRGDVDQCSFGFNIVDEETEFRDDGSVHWTIREVELFEVSVCTFPAYAETGVKARSRQLAEIQAREDLEAWKEQNRRKLNHA